MAPRTPITSKLVADLIQAAGVNRVVSVDLHAGQIQGFFNIPFDHLYAMPVLLEDYLQEATSTRPRCSSRPTRAAWSATRAYSKRLDASLAIIDKRRERANVSEVDEPHRRGEGQGLHHHRRHHRHRRARSAAPRAPFPTRARKKIVACATHGVLSGPAVQRIAESPLAEVVVTDTIPLSDAAKSCPKIKQVSIARLLGEAIKRIHSSDSVSSLFA